MTQQTPLTSVIIPFHDINNLEYLYLFLKSLTYQDTNLFVIIISYVDPTQFEPNIKKILGDIEHTVLFSPTKDTYAKKVNYGAYFAKGTHILIAQDDLILSFGAIRTMIEDMGISNAIMIPASNCDNGNQFITNFAFTNGSQSLVLKESTTKEEIIPFIQCFFQKISPFPLLQKTGFLNTYCALMTLNTWNTLGGYDEKLRNCKEDIDFSLRANQKGYPMFIDWNCFVLHFSGVTANKCDLKTDNLISNDYFNQKHPYSKDIIYEQERFVK